MKLRKSSLFLGVLASGLALASLVGCKEEPKEEARELVVWAWNKNVNAINEGIKSYQKNVDPTFKARVESFARMDIDKKFKTASQTGDHKALADIMLCDAMNVLTYYDLWSNAFLDLSSDVSKAEKDNVVQSTLAMVELDNKLVGLPFGIAPTVVFANRDLWEETDINKVKTEGWTWEEYDAIGKKIQAAHGSDVSMTSYNMRGDDRIYRTMTSQKGEWFMDKNANVLVGNETSVDAMTRIKSMVDSKVCGHIDTGDYKSLMKNGKIAAQIQGFFLGGQLKDVAPEMSGKWEVLPLPSWSTGESASITGGSYLYANGSLNGVNKDNAVKFLKYMTLNKDMPLSTLKVAGIYPALKTTYDTDYFTTTKDEYFNNATVFKNVANWSLAAKPIIATKYNGFNYDTFIKAQEKILFSTDSKGVSQELTAAKDLMVKNAK